ncbi:Rv1355c family protein [Actinomycetes bacterium M1A6_2h]
MSAPWQPQVLDSSVPDEVATLDELRDDPSIEFIDHSADQLRALKQVTPAAPDDELTEQIHWIYYPWRRTVVATLGPRGFRRLRFDRNRNKISTDEQDRLSQLKIGVVGLSVGHAIAHTLALDGICGELRLTDFDEMELSNLNRIPVTLLDLGVNKTVVAARRIAELDPYLRITIDQRGLDSSNAVEFMAGLDMIVEECDSIDVKFLVRETARTLRLPVVMQTSDRGLIDVERFDLEPTRPLFHGLVGDVDSSALAGLTNRDKVPYVMAILGAGDLSARLAASMVEVERTVSTWPQLGSEVALGGASIAAAIRRFGLGLPLPSGRLHIDLDELLDRIESPDAPTVPSAAPPPTELTESPTASVMNAARRAPSGGNVQPWTLDGDDRHISITLDPTRTTGLDVRYRGSHVALGAALFNARVAAAHAGRLGAASIRTSNGSNTVVALELASGNDASLAAMYSAMLTRATNRSMGTAEALSADAICVLTTAAECEGASVRVVSDRDALTEVAEVLAQTDRLRYLTPTLHSEMISELRWPGDADIDTGIEVESLAMDSTDLVKLDVVRRPEVMALLAEWDTGHALGDDTRDRILSSSAIAVVCFDGCEPGDFVRGGSATERVWIAAEGAGLAVHPVSPTFVYAQSDEDLKGLSPAYAPQLAELRRRFVAATGVGESQSIALVLRLSIAPAAGAVSRRRSV